MLEMLTDLSALGAELPFPRIRPDLVTIPGFSLFGLELGPFPIRWYALAYIAGLALGWWYVRRLMARPRLWAGGAAPATGEQIDDLLFWMTIGVVLGGRLGFVLFYQPHLLASDPLQVLRIWEGGMAFHGGMLGVILAVIFFARNQRMPLLPLGDAVAAATPIGLFFGRIANFINGELWGRITEVPWGMRFPQVTLYAEQYPWLLVNGENLPRHPSQLYEAALEGLVLFLVILWLVWRRDAFKTPGLVTGVFLAGYGAARFVVEFYRQWNVELGLDDFLLFELTRGQTLCLPMIAAGIAFIYLALKREKAPA